MSDQLPRKRLTPTNLLVAAAIVIMIQLVALAITIEYSHYDKYKVKRSPQS